MKSLCFNSWFQQGTICFLLLWGIQKNWHDQCVDVCWWWSSVLSSTARSGHKHRHLIAYSKAVPLATMLSFLVTLRALDSCRSVPISAVLLLETTEWPWVVSFIDVCMYLTIKRRNCEFWLGQLLAQCQVQWTQRCCQDIIGEIWLCILKKQKTVKRSADGQRRLWGRTRRSSDPQRGARAAELSRGGHGFSVREGRRGCRLISLNYLLFSARS